MNKIINRIAPYFSLYYLIHWFFLALLSIIVIFLLVFTQDTRAILLKHAKIPLMELYDFDIYQADKQGIQLHITGVKALRYAEYEEAFEMVMSKINFTKKPYYTEYMYGEEIIKVNTIYNFKKGSVYARDDGISFWSQRGNYNAESSIFTGKGDFWLVNLEGEISGINIIYNQKQQTMQAQDIQAVIALKATNSKNN